MLYTLCTVRNARTSSGAAAGDTMPIAGIVEEPPWRVWSLQVDTCASWVHPGLNPSTAVPGVNRCGRIPTVFRHEGLRFFSYSSDWTEPPHVRVERGSDTVWIWLSPVRLQDSRGFARTEMGSMLKLTGENRTLMLRSWDEFFHDEDMEAPTQKRPSSRKTRSRWAQTTDLRLLYP